MWRHIRHLRVAVTAVAGLVLGILLISQGSVAAGLLVALLSLAAMIVLIVITRRSPVAPRRGRRRSPKEQATWAAAAAGVVLALTAWNYFGHNGDLRAGDVASARGEVVDVDTRRRSADVAEVRFRTAEGDVVVARTPVDRRPRVGSPVPVEYVPDDPEKARIPDNWAPAYELLSILAAAVLAMAAIAAVVAAVKPRRQRVSST